MSDQMIVLLIMLWFAILIVGVTFTLMNTIRFVQIRRAAREAEANEEAMLLAQNHLSGETNRLIIIGFFLLMGLAVVARQHLWIGRAPFSISFYGALQAGAVFLSGKAVMVWHYQRRLRRLDAEQRKDES